MTLLAKLIANEEGFWKPGTQPARKHNPGDLRHSPHSSHAGEGADDIGEIDNDADGWADLERQLRLFADRGLTLQQAIYTFAPPSENNSVKYLSAVCDGLQMAANTPMHKVLEVQA